MNKDTPDDDPAVMYYDSDYPSEFFGKYRRNFDSITYSMGIVFDVHRYREMAAARKGPVLELCCGSGRVAIPLARDGHPVVAVDVSKGMLSLLEANLRQEEPAVAKRVKSVQADVASLSLSKRFNLIICGFNSLALAGNQDDQLNLLRAAREHLTKDGLFVCDVVNPLVTNVNGDMAPRLLLVRRNPRTGNMYTRFAMSGPLGADQFQTNFGYYDETEPDGRLRRTYYNYDWRPLFRGELELMLRMAGLAVVKMEGGHKGEPITSATAPRFFVQARRA